MENSRALYVSASLLCIWTHTRLYYTRAEIEGNRYVCRSWAGCRWRCGVIARRQARVSNRLKVTKKLLVLVPSMSCQVSLATCLDMHASVRRVCLHVLFLFTCAQSLYKCASTSIRQFECIYAGIQPELSELSIHYMHI